MTARRRFEVASYGIDETKQLVGTDPWGGQSWLGLRVPTLATTSLTPAGKRISSFRYLFMACAFSVGAGSKARIVGFRQLHQLGFVRSSQAGAKQPVVLDVTSPGWSFPDGTVTYHLRRLGGPNAQGLPSFRPSNTTDLANFRKGFSMQPALLYQSYTIPAGNPYYVNLTGYVPPNGGRPYGTPLTDDPQAGTILGLRTEWKTPDALGSMDIEVRGPDTVCVFISVAQTDPSTNILPSEQAGDFGIGISPEDAFLMNATSKFGANALQWKVGASLLVETDSLESEVRAVVGKERRRG